MMTLPSPIHLRPSTTRYCPPNFQQVWKPLPRTQWAVKHLQLLQVPQLVPVLCWQQSKSPRPRARIFTLPWQCQMDLARRVARVKGRYHRYVSELSFSCQCQLNLHHRLPTSPTTLNLTVLHHRPRHPKPKSPAPQKPLQPHLPIANQQETLPTLNEPTTAQSVLALPIRLPAHFDFLHLGPIICTPMPSYASHPTMLTLFTQSVLIIAFLSCHSILHSIEHIQNRHPLVYFPLARRPPAW